MDWSDDEEPAGVPRPGWGKVWLTCRIALKNLAHGLGCRLRSRRTWPPAYTSGDYLVPWGTPGVPQASWEPGEAGEQVRDED